MITDVEVPRALWVLVLIILIAMQICGVARWPSGKASVSYSGGFELSPIEPKIAGSNPVRAFFSFPIFSFFHKNCVLSSFFPSSFQKTPHNF